MQNLTHVPVFSDNHQIYVMINSCISNKEFLCVTQYSRTQLYFT